MPGQNTTTTHTVSLGQRQCQLRVLMADSVSHQRQFAPINKTLFPAAEKTPQLSQSGSEGILRGKEADFTHSGAGESPNCPVDSILKKPTVLGAPQSELHIQQSPSLSSSPAPLSSCWRSLLTSGSARSPPAKLFGRNLNNRWKRRERPPERPGEAGTTQQREAFHHSSPVFDYRKK